MLKKKNIISFLIIFFLVISCGYKKINTEQSLMHLQTVSVSGKNRISYLLKNDISLISNKNAADKYDVAIELKKRKQDKITNKQGKITRYTVNIDANLILKNNNNNRIINKNFSNKGDFEVASDHSETINNEKIITKIIMQQLTSEIINFITFSNKN
jgi:hypothetical protein